MSDARKRLGLRRADGPVGIGNAMPVLAEVERIGADRRTDARVVTAIAACGKPVEATALDDVREHSLTFSDIGIVFGRSAATSGRNTNRTPMRNTAGNRFCNILASTREIGIGPCTRAHLSNPVSFNGIAIRAGHGEISGIRHRAFDLVRVVASIARSPGEILGEGEEIFIRTGGSL
jgi:hypothetical protein